ncbi:MAG: hypothetical protein HIU92_03140 [Proteobacteria bacterium]|nr:hypothetical protein [Pseudomonadota bacterium]
MDTVVSFAYKRIVDEISEWDWASLTSEEMVAAACAYYYFSIQFRESLQIACELFPEDPKLAELEREECNTANLSPWPGVAAAGEKMNHDEFMRRTLLLNTIPAELAARVEAAGADYLDATRSLDPMSRALSIASYEDGGLEAVFTAMLRYDDWNNDLLRGFRHFLAEHVRFDSDPDAGHGALSRHLQPDDRVVPLWTAFRDIYRICVPRFGTN